MLKQVLGSVIILFSPLFTYSIAKMLYIIKEDINLIIKDLYFILDSLKDLTYPICLYYPSFRDFLLSKD